MQPLVDDVGSFPLPLTINRETYNKAYQTARAIIKNGEDPKQDPFAKKYFYDVVVDSFKRKLRTGLDVVNYPQHYDGLAQIGDVIHKAMEKGTFTVENKDAILPEVYVIQQEAKNLSEITKNKILLRISLFGPMEQYLKEIGTTPYSDVLEGFAETIRRFAKNSLIDTKYLKTETVSIDEPSFGFQNIAAHNDELCAIMEKAFSFTGVTHQIHLHSAANLPDLLCVKGIDVLSFEYAASPKNIEGITKRMLDQADKKIRVGISRTDIDCLTSELYDKGVTKPSDGQLVEDIETIRKRFIAAKEKFQERMSFTGPDCGLGGWPSQDAAELVLARTVQATKSQ
jgi:5-methyltetrahydropteroyltriglutamate--homocysteine methyltransferase